MKGYKLDKVYNTFKSYVDTLSEMKANSQDTTLKNISKLLLNSLIGKYGMHPLQPITKRMDKNKLGEIFLTRQVTQEVDITSNPTLVSYFPGPNKDIVEDFDVDIDDVMNLKPTDKHTYVKNISIPVAAAVTAYARVYMSKMKLDIVGKNGKIYSSDTDSIITDIELDKNLVDPKVIGKFKLEHDVDTAIMVAPKVYFMKGKDIDKTSNNKLVMKVKGGCSDNLTMNDFDNMMKGVPMEISKTSSKTNGQDGTVSITKENIILSPNNYISRNKILDSNNN